MGATKEGWHIQNRRRRFLARRRSDAGIGALCLQCRRYRGVMTDSNIAGPASRDDSDAGERSSGVSAEMRRFEPLRKSQPATDEPGPLEQAVAKLKDITEF